MLADPEVKRAKPSERIHNLSNSAGLQLWIQSLQGLQRGDGLAEETLSLKSIGSLATAISFITAMGCNGGD